MASIRDLKKDVKYLTGHFIDECYTQLAYSVLIDQENTLDIISDALELHDDFIKKLNSKPNLEESKTYKTYYSSIVDDFYKKIIELTERLNSLEN